jgi:hypothetical protein
MFFRAPSNFTRTVYEKGTRACHLTPSKKFSQTEMHADPARQTAPFPSWISGFGCRTLVGFKGAEFQILNSILSANRFKSFSNKPASFTKIVKNAAPAEHAIPFILLHFLAREK